MSKAKEILDWQQRMVIFEAIWQNTYESKKMHITEEIMDSYRAKALKQLATLFDEKISEVIGEKKYSLRSLDKMVPTGFEFPQNVLIDEQNKRAEAIRKELFDE